MTASLLSRKSRFVGAALAIVAFTPAGAQQVERRTLTGNRVAIYNLAGTLKIQGGAGPAVVVDITRGGRDASRLTLAEGAVHGANSLRVVFPGDRIVYPRLGYRTRTELRVNSDGTFDHGGGDGWFSRDRVE